MIFFWGLCNKDVSDSNKFRMPDAAVEDFFVTYLTGKSHAKKYRHSTDSDDFHGFL